MIPPKQVDVSEGFLGKRNTGKSTRALARCVELANEYHAYIIVHNREGSVPMQWPDGSPTGVVHYTTFEELRKGLVSNPGAIHAIACKDAQQVVDFAKTVAAQSYASNAGKEGNPVIVYIDEIVFSRGMSPYRLSDEARELVSMQRHYNVGIVWTTQSPSFVHYQMLRLGTRLNLFRITDEDALATIRKASVPREVLAQLPTLDNCDRGAACDDECRKTPGHVRGQHFSVST